MRAIAKLPKFRLLANELPDEPTPFAITPANEGALRAFLRALPNLKGDKGDTVKGDKGEKGDTVKGDDGRRGRRGERGPPLEYHANKLPNGYQLRFGGIENEPIVIEHGQRGEIGPMPVHEVNDAAFRLQLPNGEWGPWVRQIPGPPGKKGDTGPVGPMPRHEWDGTRLRFELPGGAFGAFVELQGRQGGGGGGMGRSAFQGYTSIGLNGTSLEFLKGKVGPLGPDKIVDLSSLGNANKNISIENFSLGDEFVFFRAAVNLTITKLSFIVQGTGPVSATAFVRFGPDRSAPATNVVNAGTVVTSTTTGDEVTVFDNAVVAAGDWVIVDITAVAGTTREELSLTLDFVS